MLNFNFSGKSLGLVPPSQFVYDFSRKMFVMLHSINLSNFIVWLTLLLKILGNIIFLIKPFWYMTKTSRQKLKYLENRKNFWGKIKSIFQGLAVAKNCLRPVCTFKAGSNTELSNYRPISVQPGFSKIHEHVMYNCLWKYWIQTFYKNSLPSRKGTKPTMQFYNL